MKHCVDCVVGSNRPAPNPGPRCATHHREKRRRDKRRAQDLKLQARYGITLVEFERLLQAQGGRCALCRRVLTGAKRMPSVDHDHGCQGCGGIGCRECIRGIVDSMCNKDVLGRFGDDPERFDAIAAYLRKPPARLVLSRESV